MTIIGIFGKSAWDYNLLSAKDYCQSNIKMDSASISAIKRPHYQFLNTSNNICPFNNTNHITLDNSQDDSCLLLDGFFYQQSRYNSLSNETFEKTNILSSFLSVLYGQFAIAYISNERMVLCRDHLGIKNLFYFCLRDGSIVFSSEIKVLIHLLKDSIKLNQKVLECFRGIGYNLFSGETVFQGIHSVKPGEYIEYNIDGNHFPHYYYVPPQSSSCIINKAPDIHLIKEEVDEGFRRCVDCDDQIPKALFFSGGLDSSYLLSFLAKNAKSKIVPFTLWDSSNASDIEDARTLASELDIDLSEHKVDWNEINRMIIHYAWHFAMPLGGSGFDLLGGVAFHVLSAIIARHGFKVALCGEGADELFIGYHQYHMDPSMLVSRLENAIVTYGLSSLKNRLTELGVFTDFQESLRRIAFDFGLSEYHLHSVECSGSAFGLEVRPPYLNYKLANLLLKYPVCQFIDKKDYWTKIPLRKMFKEVMPQTSAGSAIRRKRAMSYALYSFNERLNDEIAKKGMRISPTEAFWRLFFYLHIDNHFVSVPSFSFTDILPELVSMGERQ